MSECVFCAKEQTKDNEIIRIELFRARWDAFPATPGHVEIVPLRHVQYFEELTPDETARMMGFAQEVIGLIRQQDLRDLYQRMRQEPYAGSETFLENALSQLETVGNMPPQAFNIGLNDGPIAGQSVPHLHLHIMPRWKGDVENPRGGVRNMFPQDTYGGMR